MKKHEVLREKFSNLALDLEKNITIQRIDNPELKISKLKVMQDVKNMICQILFDFDCMIEKKDLK